MLNHCRLLFQTCPGRTPKMASAWPSLASASCRACLRQHHGAENLNQSWSWRSSTRTAWRCFRPPSTPPQSILVTKTWRTIEVLWISAFSSFSSKRASSLCCGDWWCCFLCPCWPVTLQFLTLTEVSLSVCIFKDNLRRSYPRKTKYNSFQF